MITAANSAITHYADGISAIDTEYYRQQLDASHLIVRNGRAAFVDTGPATALPKLLAALEAKDLAREQVDYVLLTHVHLDHAGGAGSLMRELPNATLVVHPRGARHMIDPSKLVAGSIQVYGEEAFKRLHGEVLPVPQERVRVVDDGERLELGGSSLELIHTEGHARHHYCIVDQDSDSIFSGDSFGISYRVFDSPAGAFIYPTTTPVQFDPEQAHATVDRILAYAPQAVFLTHYSRVTDVPRLAADLHRDLDEFVRIARRHAERADPQGAIAKDLEWYLRRRLDEHGVDLPEALISDWLAMDVQLNAQGLAVWLAGQGRTA
mgnify:CR=1 FL=1